MRRQLKKIATTVTRSARAVITQFDREDIVFFAGLVFLYAGISELNVAYARIAVGCVLLLVASAGGMATAIALILGRRKSS